jgi:hypothetical protein
MAMAEVAVLHALGTGKPKLSPSLEAESSSLGDSLRIACSDSDPLLVMPPTTMPELSLSGTDSSCQSGRR